MRARSDFVFRLLNVAKENYLDINAKTLEERRFQLVGLSRSDKLSARLISIIVMLRCFEMG